MEPEFETLDYYIESNVSAGIGKTNVDENDLTTEESYITSFSDKLKDIYGMLKEKTQKLNSELIFNPQKYYISVRYNKNH
jgi:hypothetical protein